MGILFRVQFMMTGEIGVGETNWRQLWVMGTKTSKKFLEFLTSLTFMEKTCGRKDIIHDQGNNFIL